MFPMRVFTHNESFVLECEDSDLTLIYFADRGGLKFPSDEVVFLLVSC